MKILLVNPNRYRTPPVPPLALEYLADALSRTRHECRVLDLCFSDDPAVDLDAAIRAFRPDIAGITVRNIDTVLFQNNIFFLDDFRTLTGTLKRSGAPVIAGGVGYSFIPEGVREYLGADYGVSGPGERALPALLDRLERGPVPPGTVFDGWEYGIDPDAPIERAGVVDHARYLREGGLLGFETQKGCYSRCPYCSEGRGRVFLKNPERVASEIRSLALRGFTDFHLCDTEFNQDLAHCKAFLEAMIRNGPVIRWALYLKTSPYDEDLFRLIRASGASLVTVSHPTGPDGLEHLREIRRLTRRHDLRLAVDYLCGLPGETVESVRRDIDTLREIAPDTVGVNSIYRLYPGLPVTDRILGDPSLHGGLSGAVEDNPHCIRPVFWTHITAEMLRDIIGEDPRFHIEGFDRSTNYERLRENG